jgi:hypothetical protein
MAHIYLTFDFGKDEEKAQQARHKLESWKQAFRLDKKMLYKFDRKEDALERADAGLAGEDGRHPQKAGQSPALHGEKEKPAKKAAGKAGKAAKEAKKADPEPAKLAASSAEIKLILRLALSNHEKLMEQRLLQRFSNEEPFKISTPKTIRESEAGYEQLDSHFEELV